jgi:hypothetical protein
MLRFFARLQIMIVTNALFDEIISGKMSEINALATRGIAGEQRSISQNAPHKRDQRPALEPIWCWLAGS